MTMVYTLVTSAKEWFSERFDQDTTNDNIEEQTANKDEVCFQFSICILDILIIVEFGNIR